MTLTEKAALARDAALEDLKLLIEGGHVPAVYDCAQRIVRLTRITDNFIQSGLGTDYYKMFLPGDLRTCGIL